MLKKRNSLECHGMAEIPRENFRRESIDKCKRRAILLATWQSSYKRLARHKNNGKQKEKKMSHNIQERDIQVGITQAWHGLTKVVPSIDKTNMGIIYPMRKVSLFYLDEDGKTYLPSNAEQIISEDDFEPIGNAVGKGYGLVDNESVVDAVLNALSGTKHQIVSTGSVDNRAICFVSVKLNGEVKAAGRDTISVLNITWGHGGKWSITAKNGMTIQVCENTIQMALRERGEFIFRLIHRKNAISKIEGMTEAIDAHHGITKQFCDAMDQFANESCKVEEARQIFTGFVAPSTEEELSTRSENTIDELVSLFQRGKGNTGSNRSDLFGAISDLYTHAPSGANADKWKNFVSSEFGAGQRKKAEFFEILKDEDKFQETIKRGQLVLSN